MSDRKEYLLSELGYVMRDIKKMHARHLSESRALARSHVKITEELKAIGNRKLF